MATLTGQRIKDTYDAVLKLEDNAALTSSPKAITDGLGNNTPISVSTIKVDVSSDLEASSFVKTSGLSTQFLKADGSVDSSAYLTSGDLPASHWSSNLVGIDYTGGNVGIGTTSPSQKLDVNGNIKLNQYGQSIYFGSTVNEIKGSASNFLYKSFSRVQWDNAGTYTDSSYVFKQSGSEVFRIHTGGNVGIGTTSPSEKLEVNGNVDVNGGVYVSGVNSFVWNNTANSNLRFGANGSEKMRITSAGNVGIGTTSPSAKLQIDSTSGWGVFTERGIKDGSTSTYSHNYGAGNAHILGRAMYFENAAVFSTSTADSTTKEYRFSNASDKLTVKSLVSGVTVDNNILVLSGSNVGIGTASPLNKLQVSDGSVGIDSQYMIRDNRNNTILHQSANTAASNRSLTIGNATYSNVIIPNGNVGIGTTSPSEKLEVEGDIASQGIYIDRTHEFGGISNPFAKLGLHYFWGDSNSINLQKTGNNNKFTFSTQSGYLHIVNSSGAGVQINSSDQSVKSALGTFNIGVTQHAAANNNQGNYVSITNGSNTTGSRGVINVNGDLKINDYSTSSAIEKIKLKNDGSAYFSGNVGIGTTSPNQLLEVASSAGDATISISTDQSAGSQASKKYINLDFSGYNNNVMAKIQSWDESFSGGNGYLTFSTRNASSGLLSQAMVLDYVGNVGIGTNSPSAKLHIEASDPRIKIVDTDGTNWQSEVFTQGGALKLQARNGTNFGNISFQGDNGTTQSEYARFNSVGNLGIGTTSPARTLDVAGRGRFVDSTGTVDICSSTYVPLLITNTNGYAHARINGFEVGGNTTANNEGYIKTSDNSRKLILDTNGWRFLVQNAELMRITSAGKVGIGTTSPSEKLEVDGQVLSDGYRLAAMQTAPATRNSTGTLGEIVIDGNYIYVCYAANSWSRVALETSW